MFVDDYYNLYMVSQTLRVFSNIKKIVSLNNRAGIDSLLFVLHTY